MGGKELLNLPIGKKKYNDMKDIVKFWERAVNRGVGWEIDK